MGKSILLKLHFEGASVPASTIAIIMQALVDSQRIILDEDKQELRKLIKEIQALQGDQDSSDPGEVDPSDVLGPISYPVLEHTIPPAAIEFVETSNGSINLYGEIVSGVTAALLSGIITRSECWKIAETWIAKKADTLLIRFTESLRHALASKHSLSVELQMGSGLAVDIRDPNAEPKVKETLQVYVSSPLNMDPNGGRRRRSLAHIFGDEPQPSKIERPDKPAGNA